jgi:catechol 2,3-dioxygenase-like lactoylglutathione lyase family enzyme
MIQLGQVMQLAYVPSDFDGTLKFWTETMGAGPFFVLAGFPTEWARYRGIETSPDLTVAFGHWDDMQIEIIQQHNDAPSPYRDWRLSGAEGLHHVCILVDDIVAARRVCVEAGGDVVYDGRSGETHWSYVDTGGGPGTILEMVQHAPPSRGLMDMVRDAARGWDGRDPIRTLQLG